MLSRGMRNATKNEKKQTTVIVLKRRTYNRLAEIGSKTDTFDDIVNFLLDEYYKHQ